MILDLWSLVSHHHVGKKYVITTSKKVCYVNQPLKYEPKCVKTGKKKPPEKQTKDLPYQNIGSTLLKKLDNSITVFNKIQYHV
jgi:hypothetical protein